MALTMQLFILVLLTAAFLLPPAARAGEIIGGRVAEPHSRPYMAFLWRQTSMGPMMCGGFLVREDFVLTAAHCAEGEITVHLGAHNISDNQEPSRQEINVLAKIPHPRYSRMTFNNDIMLLQLKRKAKLTRWVKTIPLPCAEETVEPGANCSVAGWGRTSAESELISDTLREADVMVLPDAACGRTPDCNPSTILCAGDPDKGKYAFKGDSGGPLVCGGKAQGIVSRGKSDGKPPTVYTRVSTFIPWIEEMMMKLHP